MQSYNVTNNLPQILAPGARQKVVLVSNVGIDPGKLQGKLAHAPAFLSVLTALSTERRSFGLSFGLAAQRS